MQAPVAERSELIEPATKDIQLRGVTKRYGSVAAVSSLDVTIRDGEFFCLLGPSGCGKTTTLNLIGGFTAPSGGSIWLGDRRIDMLPPHRRPVNTVFQSYALFPHMTVRQNVAFGLKMEKTPKADVARRVDEVLSLVGLADHGERTAEMLSGGQQQRVAVARALVKRPAVLLLDEPLGALDLKLRHRLQVQLLQIQREVGTTFVYVTHDQEEAMSMADRIAIFNGGGIEQLGTPTEVYCRPASRFVADFIGESNFFDVTVEPGGVAVLTDGTRVPCRADGVPGPATLMVRPEAIRVAPRGADRDGGLRGHAVQASFLGSYVRVAVTCTPSPVPVVVAARGEDALAIEADSDVVLSWAAADGVLLEPAGAEGELE